LDGGWLVSVSSLYRELLLANVSCVRVIVRTAGEILITLGVITLGFVAYIYWGTAAQEGNAQHAFIAQLGRQWGSAGPALTALSNRAAPALGQPFALIRIPRFGATWEFALIQGTGLPELALGPGHVPGTAMPGQLGNFAVAGHRVTAGNPFWSLPSMRPGDRVYVETRAATYSYRVTARPEWVSSADNAVEAPVPGRPGVAPHRALITLITCDPPWTGVNRIVVTGVLVGTAPKARDVRS
jgi:sortase A